MDMKKSFQQIVLVAMFLTSCVCLGLEFWVQDRHGTPLERAVVDVPFCITLALDKQCDARILFPCEQTFRGVQVLDRKTHQSTMINNGKKAVTTTVTWVVRAHEPGMVRCGQCEVTLADQVYQVPARTVPVDAQEAPSGKTPRAELKFRDTTVYVGQAVACEVRCYHEAGAQDFSVHIPQGFEKSFLFDSGPDSRSFGSHVETVWRGFFYPDHAGDVTIPACGVRYVMIDQQRSRSFFSFTGPSFVPHTVYTNGTHLQVLPVPGEVEGVGTNIRVRSEIDHSERAVGSVATYRMKVRGSAGSLYRMKRPAFVVPDGLRVYEGNDQIIEQGSERVWEWIVHPVHPGTYTISSPQVRVFNPTTRKIEIHASDALTLQITGAGLIPDNDEAAWRIEHPRDVSDTVSEKKIKPLFVWPTYAVPLLVVVLYVSVLVLLLLWGCVRRYAPVWYNQVIRIPLMFFYYRSRIYRACTARRYDEMIRWCDQLLVLVYPETAREMAAAREEFMRPIESSVYAGGVVHHEHLKQNVDMFVAACKKRVGSQRLGSCMSVVMVGLSIFATVAQAGTIDVSLFKQYREAQYRAPLVTYYQLQRELDTMVHDAGKQESSRIRFLVRCCAHLFPFVLVQILFLISMGLVVCGWVFVQAQYAMKVGLWGGALSFLLLCGYVYERHEKVGYVITKDAHLYAGPSEHYGVIGSIPYLEEIEREQEHNEWIKVRHATGRGWIKQNDVLTIASVT